MSHPRIVTLLALTVFLLSGKCYPRYHGGQISSIKVTFVRWITTDHPLEAERCVRCIGRSPRCIPAAVFRCSWCPRVSRRISIAFTGPPTRSSPPYGYVVYDIMAVSVYRSRLPRVYYFEIHRSYLRLPSDSQLHYSCKRLHRVSLSSLSPRRILFDVFDRFWIRLEISVLRIYHPPVLLFSSGTKIVPSILLCPHTFSMIYDRVVSFLFQH